MQEDIENRTVTLVISGGKLTGKVKGDIVDGEAKRHTLQLVRRHHGFTPETVIAAGDGANDLPMLHEAGVGIAYHAKPVVAAAAAARIEHGDLTALLWAQGIPRREWVPD